MSDDYTPSNHEVRDAYRYETGSDGCSVRGEDAIDEFERWIALVRAEAWDFGLVAGCDRWMDVREFGDKPVNPYRNPVVAH